jgi:CDP-6-deoxy-D-xylo-4-hexulose-3-dehydrase
MDGKTYQNTGSFGDLATSSFYPPHHMTTGEGGAIYTNNHIIYKILLSMRDWGRDCICPSGKDNICGKRFNQQLGELPLGYDHKYTYSHFGYNFNGTDLQMAIGVAQLDKIDWNTSKRRENYKYLFDGLKNTNVEKYITLPQITKNSKPSPFGFPILCKNSELKNEIVNNLEKNNIQTRMLFAGNMLRQPCFDEMRKNKTGYRAIDRLTNTDTIMNNLFWVGVYPNISKKMLDYIIELIVKSC